MEYDMNVADIMRTNTSSLINDEVSRHMIERAVSLGYDHSELCDGKGHVVMPKEADSRALGFYTADAKGLEASASLLEHAHSRGISVGFFWSDEDSSHQFIRTVSNEKILDRFGFVIELDMKQKENKIIIGRSGRCVYDLIVHNSPVVKNSEFEKHDAIEFARLLMTYKFPVHKSLGVPVVAVHSVKALETEKRGFHIEFSYESTPLFSNEAFRTFIIATAGDYGYNVTCEYSIEHDAVDGYEVDVRHPFLQKALTMIPGQPLQFGYETVPNVANSISGYHLPVVTVMDDSDSTDSFRSDIRTHSSLPHHLLEMWQSN